MLMWASADKSDQCVVASRAAWRALSGTFLFMRGLISLFAMGASDLVLPRLRLATEKHVELTAWRRLQGTARAGAKCDLGGQRDTGGHGVVEKPSRPRPTGCGVADLTDERRSSGRTDRRPHVDGAK